VATSAVGGSSVVVGNMPWFSCRIKVVMSVYACVVCQCARVEALLISLEGVMKLCGLEVSSN
jgi:hypothetical protein